MNITDEKTHIVRLIKQNKNIDHQNDQTSEPRTQHREKHK